MPTPEGARAPCRQVQKRDLGILAVERLVAVLVGQADAAPFGRRFVGAWPSYGGLTEGSTPLFLTLFPSTIPDKPGCSPALRYSWPSFARAEGKATRSPVRGGAEGELGSVSCACRSSLKDTTWGIGL